MRDLLTRYGLIGLLLAGALPLTTGTAGAETATTVTIGSVTAGGSDIVVTGSLAYGADAAAPIQVAEDGPGDDADSGRVPNGTDIGNGRIATDLVGRKLTFAFDVHDQTPGAKMAPTMVYVWAFSVNGSDEGRFLSSGTAGSWTGLGPIVEPNGWFRLCQVTTGYSCPTATTGTMGNGKVEINLPFSMAGIKPGALIEPGGVVCGTLCSTFNPVVQLFNNFGGDTATLVGYQTPGKVELGIAPATTPDEAVKTPVTAVTVMPNGKTTGTFSGAVTAPPAPGEYKIVAKTCFGNIDAPVCSLTSSPFSVA